MIDRIKRINQLIKGKIAELLLREITFDKNILVTVQNVNTSRDLRYAKVGVSIMPTDKSEEILRILKKQSPYIQKELNKVVKIKFIPKIKFEIDRGKEKAGRVEEILRRI